MKDIKSKLSILVVCVFLGLILAIQFKTVNETVGFGVIPNQRAQQLAVELKKLQEERDNLQRELDNLESKVKQYEEGEAEKNVYVENLYKDLQKYKMIAGYEAVEGPGIILEIDDPPMEVQFGDDTSTILSNYDLLLQVISVLNAADAEAISINDQRYTSYTEIEPAGSHIEINGVSLGPPFIIKAIGKPDTLEFALRIKGGIIWYMERSLNLSIQIKQQQKIEIPKYRKIKEFRYANPINNPSN